MGMRLVLVGAPGSGKGTQAEMLSNYYGVPRVSLGDILRQEVDRGTDPGKIVKEYMERGELVPDKIINELITAKINGEGFILDGYPRNLSQARSLDKLLVSKNRSLDKVIFLKVGLEVVIRRLSGRRVCKNCGALYHLVTMPPQKENICDKCKGELIIRDDDKEETIKRRWEVFLKEVEGLIDFYSQGGRLIEVEANMDKEKVFKKIISLLKEPPESF